MGTIRQPDETVTLRTLHGSAGGPVDRVRYQDKHIQITRSGKPVAMLVPIGWWRRANVALDRAAELTDADIDAWHENDETGAPDEHQHQDHAPADEPGPPGVAPTVADSLANSQCRDSGGTGPGLDPLPAHRPSTGGQP